MTRKTINIVDANGTANECEILFSFEDYKTGEHFIVYNGNMGAKSNKAGTYVSKLYCEEEKAILSNDIDERIKIIANAIIEAIKKLEE